MSSATAIAASGGSPADIRAALRCLASVSAFARRGRQPRLCACGVPEQVLRLADHPLEPVAVAALRATALVSEAHAGAAALREGPWLQVAVAGLQLRTPAARESAAHCVAHVAAPARAPVPSGEDAASRRTRLEAAAAACRDVAAFPLAVESLVRGLRSREGRVAEACALALFSVAMDKDAAQAVSSAGAVRELVALVHAAELRHGSLWSGLAAAPSPFSAAHGPASPLAMASPGAGAAIVPKSPHSPFSRALSDMTRQGRVDWEPLSEAAGRCLRRLFRRSIAARTALVYERSVLSAATLSEGPGSEGLSAAALAELDRVLAVDDAAIEAEELADEPPMPEARLFFCFPVLSVTSLSNASSRHCTARHCVALRAFDQSPLDRRSPDATTCARVWCHCSL